MAQAINGLGTTSRRRPFLKKVFGELAVTGAVRTAIALAIMVRRNMEILPSSEPIQVLVDGGVAAGSPHLEAVIGTVTFALVGCRPSVARAHRETVAPKPAGENTFTKNVST